MFTTFTTHITYGIVHVRYNLFYLPSDLLKGMFLSV